MSRFALVAAMSLCASIVATPRIANSQTSKDTSLKRETLADNIYLFRAPSDLDKWTATNVVVVINDQDVTVFDSNTRPVTTRMVIAEIQKLTQKPVRTLINSHWHMDHWSGNNEYVKAFPGVQIIATTETRDFMKRMPRRFFADGLKGHLLICHGMVDTNVFFQDSVRLVQRLIELRKENWEIAPFPVENHGFTEETSWADEYKRILKLFEGDLRK